MATRGLAKMFLIRLSSLPGWLFGFAEGLRSIAGICPAIPWNGNREHQGPSRREREQPLEVVLKVCGQAHGSSQQCNQQHVLSKEDEHRQLLAGADTRSRIEQVVLGRAMRNSLRSLTCTLGTRKRSPDHVFSCPRGIGPSA